MVRRPFIGIAEVLESVYRSSPAETPYLDSAAACDNMLQNFLRFARNRGAIQQATAAEGAAITNVLLQQHDDLTAALALELGLWVLSMEGRPDAAIVGAMAQADTPRDLGAIWKYLLSINDAFPDELAAARMEVTMKLLFPVLMKSIEVLRRMGTAIAAVLQKRTKLDDMKADAPVRALVFSMLHPHAGLSELLTLAGQLASQLSAISPETCGLIVPVYEVVAQFLQESVEISDFIAFMGSRPLIIHSLFKACSLSCECYEAVRNRPHSVSQLLSCIKAATFSADLIGHIISRSPETVEAVQGLDLLLVNALMLSTSMVVSAQLSNQAGDTRLPNMHLSFVGTSLRAAARLMRKCVSPTKLPSAAGARAAGGAAASGDGLLSEDWARVMKMACKLAWHTLALRYSANARVGDLEEIHATSASLINLGLEALTLADTLAGRQPSDALSCIEAAMRCHHTAPEALRATPHSLLTALTSLSVPVPQLALASLSYASPNSSNDSGGSETSGAAGYESALSMLCTVRKASTALLSSHAPDVSIVAWGKVLSGLLLSAVHPVDTVSSSSSRGSQLGAGGSASPRSHSLGCLSLQHHASALQLATLSLVQLLPPFCSGAQSQLEEYYARIKDSSASATSSGIAAQSAALQALLGSPCAFLRRVLETLVAACGGLGTLGYLEPSTAEEAGGLLSTAREPASGSDLDPDPDNDPDPDPARDAAAFGCDGCRASLALERDRSLALAVGAAGASEVPHLLGAASMWLRLLLGLRLGTEQGGDNNDRLLLVLRLSLDATRCLDAVIGMAVAATGVPLGSDPSMPARERAAAARVACGLVNELLRCRLLRQLASGELLQVLCSSEMEAAAGGAAARRDGGGAESEPGIVLLMQQRLSLMPILFNRLTLSLTQCVRALAAAAVVAMAPASASRISDDGLSEGSSGRCGPMGGPQQPAEQQPGSQSWEAHCESFHGCVARCLRQVEGLTIVCCKLTVSSQSLKHFLKTAHPVSGPAEEERGPSAGHRFSRLSKGRAGSTAPPEAALAADRDAAALACSMSREAALLQQEALEGCMAIGGSLKELGDAYFRLVSLRELGPDAAQPADVPSRVQEATELGEPELLALCGRDWGTLALCLERFYLGSEGLGGCCGNVSCANMKAELDLDLELSLCGGGCCRAWYCSKACEVQAKPHHVCGPPTKTGGTI